MLLRAPSMLTRSSLSAATSTRISQGCRPAVRVTRTFHASSTSSSSSPTRTLTVLGLESSADDSCCAIVNSDRQILANVVLKQHDINAKFGGIHPMKAQEAHEKNVPVAIGKALAEANLKLDDLDAIAYTRGPGMYGCLSVSAASARALAAAAGKPLVGVHHMQAHALTPLLTEKEPPEFPFLTLLVSGGHTQLVLAKTMSDFSIVANTLDNCIGDAFDKAARALRLGHNAERGLGAELEGYAAKAPLPPHDQTPHPPLLRPLRQKKHQDVIAFSFAGLLTDLERKIKAERGRGIPNEALVREMARVFQEAAVGHIVDKVGRFIDMNAAGVPVKSLVVSGGVGSNLYLRKQLSDMLEPKGIKLFYPPIALCTDNAAMIAWTAVLRLQNGLIGESPALPIRKKWSLEDLYDDVPPEAYGTAQK